MVEGVKVFCRVRWRLKQTNCRDDPVSHHSFHDPGGLDARRGLCTCCLSSIWSRVCGEQRERERSRRIVTLENPDNADQKNPPAAINAVQNADRYNFFGRCNSPDIVGLRPASFYLSTLSSCELDSPHPGAPRPSG